MGTEASENFTSRAVMECQKVSVAEVKPGCRIAWNARLCAIGSPKTSLFGVFEAKPSIKMY